MCFESDAVCSLHNVTVPVLQNGHIWKHWAPTSGSVRTIWRPAYQTVWPWAVIWSSHMAALPPIPCFRNQSRLCYYSYAHNICTYSFKHRSASVLLSLQKQGRCVSSQCLLGRFKDAIVSQCWKVVFKSLFCVSWFDFTVLISTWITWLFTTASCRSWAGEPFQGISSTSSLFSSTLPVLSFNLF